MDNFSCRICRSKDFCKTLDLGDQPWGNDYILIDEKRDAERFPLIFGVCKTCMTAQINFTVAKEKMFSNHSYLSGTTKSLKEHFVEVGKDILIRKKFSDKDFILDIGGNDGTFLEYFKDKNIDVLNVDSGSLQSNISNEKNIECLKVFFNEDTASQILSKKGKAKVIHGSGIFFHLEDLHSVFSGIKLLLDKDGILVAEFIYLPQMMSKCAYDQIYHEHLLYYSLISFQRLLDLHNLEIFDASIYPIHGGSCLAYISHKGENKKTKELQGLLEKEISEGIDDLQTYLDFGEKAKHNKNLLNEIIQGLKKENKSIQALGAPVKGSTIINFCGLTEEEIDCGVEINPHKFNTYFPGTKIPVFDEASKDKPDVYLLLAWNFQEEIFSKMIDFRNQGGKFLIPISNIGLL